MKEKVLGILEGMGYDNVFYHEWTTGEERNDKKVNSVHFHLHVRIDDINFYEDEWLRRMDSTEEMTDLLWIEMLSKIIIFKRVTK